MKYIFTLLFILVAFILERKWIPPLKIESFHLPPVRVHEMKKQTIWIYSPVETSPRYWSSFYSRRHKQPPYSIVELSLESVRKHTPPHIHIQILNDRTIQSFIKTPFLIDIEKLPYAIKYEYIKYYILYHYGGLWIPDSTIMFKDPSLFFNRLNYYNVVLFRGDLYNRVIACNPGNPIIKQIVDFITDKSNHMMYHFQLYTDISSIIQSTDDIHYLHTDYNLSVDSNNKPISIENLISHHYTIIKNPEKALCFVVHIADIQKYVKYHWLLRLNKTQLLESNMWLSKLCRFSLGMEQYVYRENTDYLNPEIKLFPDSKEDLIAHIKHSNLYQHNPYLLISKSSTRNT